MVLKSELITSTNFDVKFCLSKTIVVIRRAFSKAVLFLMSKPLCAESAVDFATTNGTAKPKACGQQITITVTMRSMANAKVSPVKYQYKKVEMPENIAMNVNHFAALSAKSWVFDLEF